MSGSKYSRQFLVFLGVTVVIFTVNQMVQYEAVNIPLDIVYNSQEDGGANEIHRSSNFVQNESIEIWPPRTFRPEMCGWSQDTRVKRILVLSRARSGSSLTGELLSAEKNDAFFFEPLKSMSRELYNSSRHSVGIQKAIKMLDGIFNCSPKVLGNVLRDKWSARPARKIPLLQKSMPYYVHEADTDHLTDGHEKSPTALVIKVIRLRLTPEVIEWLQENPDILIIHLVRDPRAMIYSIQHSVDWGPTTRNPKLICNQMAADLEAGSKLNSSRYRILKYEDLVEKTEEVTKSLFQFIHRQRTPGVLKYIATHLNRTSSVTARPGLIESVRSSWRNFRRPFYYSTHPRRPYSHYAWKVGLSNKQIVYIEQLCGSILKTLQYEHFHSDVRVL